MAKFTLFCLWNSGQIISHSKSTNFTTSYSMYVQISNTEYSSRFQMTRITRWIQKPDTFAQAKSKSHALDIQWPICRATEDENQADSLTDSINDFLSLTSQLLYRCHQKSSMTHKTSHVRMTERGRTAPSGWGSSAGRTSGGQRSSTLLHRRRDHWGKAPQKSLGEGRHKEHILQYVDDLTSSC